MTRKKVKMVWIANDSARKVSFKKRRQGFLKKVSELSTLCGVNAFAIVYSPDLKEPVFCPSSRPAINRLLTTYQSLTDMERYKKMTNQETYLKQRVAKVKEQLKKQQKISKESEMAYLMCQINRGKRIDELTVTELQGLIWLVDMRMKKMRERLSYLRQVSFPFQPRQEPPRPTEAPPPSATENTHVPVNGLTRETLMWDQWLIGMMMNNNGNLNISGTGWNETATIANNLYQDRYVGGNRNEFGALWHHSWDRSFIAANDGTVYVHNDFGPWGNMSTSLVSRSAGGGNGAALGWGLQPDGHAGEGSELGLPFRIFRGNGGGAESGLALHYDGTKPKDAGRKREQS